MHKWVYALRKQTFIACYTSASSGPLIFCDTNTGPFHPTMAMLVMSQSTWQMILFSNETLDLYFENVSDEDEK